MFPGKDLILSGMTVREVEFGRSEAIFVPGRSFHGLTWRLSGRISITAQGQKLESQAGSLTCVPMGVSYGTEILESGRMIAVHFTTLEGSCMDCPAVMYPEHPVVFDNLFSALLRRFKVGRERDYACFSMLYEILSEAAHESTRAQRAAIPRRMRQAKERIDRDYADSMLGVKQLAAQAGVSEVYFRREFKQHFGTSPRAYIRNIRMENAKSLLLTGYFSVGETAARCGFDSISYFSSEFHRMTGMTPSEFARNQGER